MKNLTREQAIQFVNDLFKEDLSSAFNEQADQAGENGDPSFVVKNSKGDEVEVFVDWNKEEDILSYAINEDNQSE
ncbi:hypothetical protein [Oceanobacillus luteolus]|uniref:PepSY domain-containing protein n=1 Tax=Oceanobacillus luteolus TaxID=1274358 RepID=A0ABW4HQK0_9BACI